MINKTLLTKHPGGRPRRIKTREQYVLQQYQNSSAKEMAEMYGVSYGTMCRWLREAREIYATA